MKKHADVNGCRIAYREEGSGEPIVLIHGLCGSAAYWKYVLPLLAADYRVIVPDLRGHGDSDAPEDGPYTVELMADDIAALLDQLQIETATLFGHSLGGYVTLAFAERHVQRLRAFSLVHSMAYPDSEEAKAGRIKAAESIREHGMVPYMKTLAPKLFAPALVETLADEVAHVRKIGEETKPIGAINTLLGMKERPDRNHVLRETAVPVLLVAGEHDQVIPPDKTFSVQKSQIAEVLLKEVGHMSMLEAPEDLHQALSSFLQQK
ncbi:alpha/beta fold hydrolase [Brevibacillus migulae]|uniref:alpha/beta fold hydrolase n=1 Tax=Brevibacillus migulae TaxID=1644114 RepID=UPI00106E3AFB|nr:alpha/beta fold hydrolase [Brevibacillus migulae]